VEAAAVLIPIKAFSDAKERLAPVLDPELRNRLARWTAERVIAAAGELPVHVTCDDDEVAQWARAHGANVLLQPGKGLNNAVNDAVTSLVELGCGHVVIVHADLPRPHSLSTLIRPGAITLVPDRRGDGTNVISLPAGSGMRVSYGAASFRRHLATVLALPETPMLEVVRDPFLALDVDTPADLEHPLVREVLPSWLRTTLGNRPRDPRR
jgi:2-phospho-L-lactate guanylyltransferase